MSNERRAMIEHILDDGSIAKVDCEVESYSAELDQFWISYSDPEDEDCAIMDFVDRDEVEFIDGENT